ncbi:MAG: heme biosynthesis protein [Desulfobacter postgatei]|uniref:Heme biosynthesis protein n=1 Tax=Desulfobacter postgatei TaxID=2293 RepID=A0A2G6MTD5_9BACT|nr:MAG: heme biosynthesis protein [Desulfobacter postgatei]
MKKQTVAFSKQSANLFFHILTRCNLRCAHCYINRDQHGSNTLSLETIKAWLGIFASKAKETNLIFLGGEPTLHPDLSSAVSIAGSMGFKSITIDTNGFLFHNILDKITPDQIDFFSFSLDGVSKETNDAIRGDGCFDAVMSGISTAVEKGFTCSMIYTVSEKNIHEVPKLPELVRDLGISRFFIQVVGLRGESENTDARHQVSKSIWQASIPKTAAQIAEQGIIVTYPKVFLTHEETFECAANVADNYFIFPNGRVYQCPLCEDFAFHSHEIIDNVLTPRPKINETDFFSLHIPEGCVMNKLIQPGNLSYDDNGFPRYKIACCMLKEELQP